MPVLVLLLLAVAPRPQGGPLVDLEVDAPVEGELVDGDEPVSSPVLSDPAYAGTAAVGRSYRLTVPTDGSYRVELRSLPFDAYLVLRDEDGEVLAEDDDGLLATDARILAELRAGEVYRVDACALHGGRGAFRLAVRHGPPPTLDAEARAQAEIEEWERRLDWSERNHGPDALETSTSLNELAVRHERRGDLEEARALHERALAIRLETLGPDHPWTALSLRNLGWVLHQQGESGQGREHLERALAIHAGNADVSPLETAGFLFDLGDVRGALGDHEGAGEAFRESLAIREEHLGAGHPDTAVTRTRIAQVAMALGDWVEARRHLEGARATFEALPGQDGWVVWISNKLGALELNAGDYRAAASNYEAALEGYERLYGPSHPNTGVAHTNLGTSLRFGGEPERARPHLESGLEILEGAFGPDDLRVASACGCLGSLFLDLGEYESAGEQLRRSLGIRERALGPDHPDTGLALNDLASLYEDLGRADEALEMFERALAIAESALGPDHPDVGERLNNIASLLMNRGDLAEAREVFERVVAIDEAALGDHPRTAIALCNLANLMTRQGEAEAAIPLHRRALAIRRATLHARHGDVAISLNGLGGALEALGRYEEALSCLEQSLEISEEAFGPENPELAFPLTRLAGLHDWLNRDESARHLYERALALRSAALGPRHPLTVQCLGELAGLSQEAGDLVEARAMFQRVLDVQEESLGLDHPDTMLTINSLGAILTAQGDYEASRQLIERALAISEEVYGPEHPSTAMMLTNLALLLRTQGRFDEARPHHERALEILSTTRPGSTHHARAMRAHATLLWAEGDHEEAERFLLEALDIFERTLGEDHAIVARALSDLGGVRRALGDLDGARTALERALAIERRTSGALRPAVERIQVRLAKVLLDLDEVEAAWKLFDEERDGRTQRHRAILSTLTEGERYAYHERIEHHLVIELEVVRKLGTAEADLAAYEGLLEWKGLAARLSARGHEAGAMRLTPEQRAVARRVQALQSDVSRLVNAASMSDSAAHLGEIEAVRSDLQRLESELVASLSSGDRVRSRWHELRDALPDEAVFVDLFFHRTHVVPDAVGHESDEPVPDTWSERRAGAWITTPTSDAPRRVDLGPAEDLERAVNRHLAFVRTGSDPGRGIGARSGGGGEGVEPALSEFLWAPLASHLEDAALVFVSPDGFLGALPWETVPTEGGRLAVEDHGFVYVQDATGLARADGAHEAEGSLLLVGDVDYGGRTEEADPSPARATGPLVRSVFYPPLPGTRTEVETVARIHAEELDPPSERTLLTGRGATEDELKAELETHAVIHLATHGFLNPAGLPSLRDLARTAVEQERDGIERFEQDLVGKRPGLLSGLALAGANGTAEGAADGLLTAEEIGWLDLTGAELVILSACDTGLGLPKTLEGFVGLRRAFHVAGAKTVVSTLWSVPDASTAELMRDFYLNLWTRGLGRAESLRRAQLAMLERNRREHGGPLPATWGAFVLSGEWR